MTSPLSDIHATEQLDRIAGEFIERHRRGERPDMNRYAEDHPELAARIRELFPALLLMERVRPTAEEMEPAAAIPASLDERKLERLGDFRVLREVGRGGMGIVYEAEQISLGRHVALKVLPYNALLDPRYLRRFHNEARAAGRLHHTNIVPVFGVGEHEGIHFYIMQFIQGVSLDEVIAELRALRRRDPSAHSAPHAAAPSRPNAFSAVTLAETLLLGDSHESLSQIADNSLAMGIVPCGSHFRSGPGDTTAESSATRDSDRQRLGESSLPGMVSDNRAKGYWKSIARLCAQVADALHYAHQQGILHRDIKPANLLLDAKGSIWVTDFGLARVDEDDALTRSGDVIGTMRYMAPEQLQGKAEARSDIYSLGATLYELATLRATTDADDRGKLMKQVMDATPRAPRQIDSRIPVDLETIILKSISKLPADRYLDAAALSADLNRFLDDRPIDARRISPAERAIRWCRRNPVVSSLVTAVMVLAAGLAASAAISSAIRRERDTAIVNQRRAEKAEATSQQMLDRAVAAEREAKILTHLEKARSWRSSQRVGQRTLALDEIRKAAALQPSPEIAAELRNAAIEALNRADLIHSSSREVSNQSAVQVDPGISRYAVLDFRDSRTIAVFRVSDSQLVARMPIPDLNIWHATIDWTPDGGKLIAVYSVRDREHNVLHVWDVERKERILDIEVNCEVVRSPVGVHPTGRYLAVPTIERDIAVWDLVELREARRFRCGMRPMKVQFDRTGERLAVTGFTGESPAAIYDFESGQRILDSWTMPVRGPAAFAPGGRLIAAGSGNPAEVGNIVVWDSAEQRVISTLEGHTAMISFLQFFHGDELIISNGWEGTTRLWDALTGDCLLEFSGAMLGVGESDSQIALQLGNELVIAEISTGDICQRLSVPGGGNPANGVQPLKEVCAFNQSDELAFGCDNSGIRIWDIQRGALISSLPIGPTTNLLVHRSGKALVTAGEVGILRWPITRMEVQGIAKWTIGPPIKLRQTTDVRAKCVTWLNEQRQLAFGEWGRNQVTIIDADPDDGTDFPEMELPADHQRIFNLSASPNGRWLAASGWKEGHIQVWDVALPSSPVRLPHSDGVNDTLFYVQFSPDSKRLVCIANNEASGQYTYQTGTWKRLSALRGNMRPIIHFSPDGNLACRQDGEHEQVILADGSSGVELARLPSPCQVHKFHEFSHDGRSIVFLSDRNSLEVIRLGRIADLLSDLGLQWAIEIPPSPADVLRAHEVSVDLGTVAEDYAKAALLRQARRLAQLARDANSAKDYQGAVENYHKSLELAPDEALTLNNFAWLLATCPDDSFLDAKRALELSRRADRIIPDSSIYLNTLGVAQYRNGMWREAIATLTRAEELDPQTYFGFNGFFLAMSHQQLGEIEPARRWFEQSIQWMEAGHASDPELVRFRAEAATMIDAGTDEQDGRDAKDGRD